MVDMKGRVHSIESMGLVDGPGIRTVVFLQGCNLRCQYCHNPDTWDLDGGKEMSAQEIVNKVKRFKPYFKDTGGVTFSGGEPLLQKEFLLEMLIGCKAENIHTCVDTAGYAKGDFSDILKYIDLILFDIKHEDIDMYKNVTRREQQTSLDFLSQAQKAGVPLWIRHVVVPGLTDDEEHIKNLGEYISTLQNVQKVELLPFHQLGANKYQGLGIKYPLEGVQPMDKELTKKLESMLKISANLQEVEK